MFILHILDGIIVFLFEKIVTRKFINKDKNETDAKKDVSAEDEWAHLAGEKEDNSIEEKIESKIDAADVADVGDRIVTFGKAQQKNEGEAFDSLHDKVRSAMDAAGNTGQYIRFVNNHIDSQRKEIEKIKKIKDKFDHEIDLLQSNRTKLDSIINKKISNPDVNMISETLKQLLLEKGITKSKLDSLKNEILSVETELQQQEDQIEEVSDEIKHESNKEKINEEKIKEELDLLMKKYGVTNLADLQKFMKK